MKRGALLGTSVLALAAIAVGCTGGGDDPTFGDYGGEVQVLNITLGAQNVATGQAVFFSDYVPNTGDPAPSANPYEALPIDQCITDAQANQNTDGSVTFVSVGPNVRIIGDGGTLTWNQFFPGAYVGGNAAGADVPPGSTADVEWDSPATTLSNAISMPDVDVATQITAPDPTSQLAVVPTTGDMTFTWNTFGSDEVLIVFNGDPGGICRVADDGSFAVPASVLAQVQTTGGELVLLVGANVGFEDAVLGTSAAAVRSVNMVGITGRAWAMP